MSNVKISSEFIVQSSVNNTIIIAISIECGEGIAAKSKESSELISISISLMIGLSPRLLRLEPQPRNDPSIPPMAGLGPDIENCSYIEGGTLNIEPGIGCRRQFLLYTLHPALCTPSKTKTPRMGVFVLDGDPTGIRTRTTNVRGWRPNH